MLILGLTFLLSQHTNALPLVPVNVLASEPSCQCPNSNDTRSTVDIVWSCVATMFACTWVAVHPNIPAEEETWYSVAIRRIKLMFWAIIAPEMIIFWAMRQWVNAKKIAVMYEGTSFPLQYGGS
ncbi:hypothetical protein BDQ17DRAFT_111573 [Cyathus striatus]|nr:hypothetical protein BDQ17DRAFT_111573 [Cyathus striatus]